jgi:hypothetical protein
MSETIVKQYVVRLRAEERATLEGLINTGKQGSIRIAGVQGVHTALA